MNGAAIFVYHNFVEKCDDGAPARAAERTYVLTRAQFASHLAALAAPGLRASGLAGVLAMRERGRFVLSFDDGYASDYTVAFPMLTARGWPGCFFIVASRIGKPRALSWPQLREMAAAGMEIGSHSLTHPILQGLAPTEIRREFEESKRILEDGLGQAVTLASLPYGKAVPGTGAVMAQLGYRAFCTSEPGLVDASSDPFELPRIAVKRRTSPAFLLHVLAGRPLTLATLRSCHAVKRVGQRLLGAERWRRARHAVAVAAGRAGW